MPKTYFETKIQVPAGVKYARATALDAAGAPLGGTRPVLLE